MSEIPRPLKAFLIALVPALVLGPAGCANAPPSTVASTVTPDSSTATAEDDDDENTTPATQAPEGRLDAAGAIAAALAHTPGAVVEVDADLRVWEVTVLRADGTGVELYIDATSGEITRQRDKRLTTVQRTAPQVTAAEAIGLALAHTPGTIIELDLDTHRGAVVWEVLVRADAGGRFELYIDAATGQVVKSERAT